MNVFDWDKVRPALTAPSPSRKMVIAAAFNQYVEGNSHFEEMNSTEMRIAFDTWQACWIICEETMQGI